ncbi:unnamed protein product [Rotaria sordida]|uniref:alpha-amylase n=1 Tax=Rotaria sordida TaxID=392033 RepID=A0A815RWY4_9BILA|nr:unnamed protein product [Rotaria sordida]
MKRGMLYSEIGTSELLHIFLPIKAVLTDSHSRLDWTDTKNPNSAPNRHVAVHLFEWKWMDIAAECERFLGPMGYSGVQVSPPNEHVVLDENPWYQRYQPVSYKLISRSGTEEQFIDMVNRCNAVGVRIYVDAVINHMSYASGKSSGGSPFFPANLSFPGVPYSAWDFSDHLCNSGSGGIENYDDIYQVRNCRLVGLPDLSLSKEWVIQKIVDYLNHLLDLGVAGFRIDAAKHMWPEDLNKIIRMLKNLREDIYGPNHRPFIYFEVIDMGGGSIRANHYSWMGRVSEFLYGKRLSDVISKNDGQKLKYLRNFGSDWGFLPDGDAQIMIDNHDNQRGHGGGGNYLTFFEFRQYKIASTFMLSWPYGYPVIMSSYRFDRNNDGQGPPSNDRGETNDVPILEDGSCGGGWVCEHRWRQIANFVQLRNVVWGYPVENWWDNGDNQIAFSRGDRAFVAINNDDYSPLDQWLQTGLPAGEYCDIVSGSLIDGRCTGKQVTVHQDGKALIQIGNLEQDPIIGLHINARLSA